MNFIHIAGHLGADPEVRFTSSGKKVTTLRVACRARKGQTDETIWYRVTIWGEQYDKIVPYFKKGSSIVVAGELRKPEIFNDKEGKPQISMEITAAYIQFSPFGKSGGPQQEGGSQQQQHQAAPSSSGFSEGVPNPYMPGYPPGAGMAVRGDTHDDEVPF